MRNYIKIIACKTTLIIYCVYFFPAKVTSQHTYKTFYTNDAFVNYILAKNKTENAAIIMIPGLNLSTYIYSTTPDGRKGWAEMFADRGYNVYMVNDPKFDFATGGFIAPYSVPTNGKPATPGSQQAWQTDIWRRWGFGSSQGNPYPNAQFPTDSFAVFAKNYPFLGISDKRYEDAIQAVIDTTGGKVWILAHSAGAQPAVLAAIQKKASVKGLILIEPAGPPDSTNFPVLNGLHMFGVYGDYISSRNQTNRKIATETAATLFRNAGGTADVVSLPEDSLVFGNSHILMQDLNNKYIFDIIEYWLRQFSSLTTNINNEVRKEIAIELYPNPTINTIWIKDKSIIGTEFCIYSIDGSILKKSVLMNQKIDLTGLPTGILLIKFRYKEQIIIKKIIKINQ